MIDPTIDDEKYEPTEEQVKSRLDLQDEFSRKENEEKEEDYDLK